MRRPERSALCVLLGSTFLFDEVTLALARPLAGHAPPAASVAASASACASCCRLQCCADSSSGGVPGGAVLGSFRSGAPPDACPRIVSPMCNPEPATEARRCCSQASRQAAIGALRQAAVEGVPGGRGVRQNSRGKPASRQSTGGSQGSARLSIGGAAVAAWESEASRALRGSEAGLVRVHQVQARASSPRRRQVMRSVDQLGAALLIGRLQEVQWDSPL